MCIHPPVRSRASQSVCITASAIRRPVGGFTLIEVLFAMALLMMIIGGVYGIADGAIRLGISMNHARVSETRLTNFTTAWRDYLENLPPTIRLSCGLQKVKRGAGGNLLIEGGQVPFIWTRGVRMADAVEFAVVRGREAGSLQLNVRHLKRLEKPNALDAYEQMAELPLLESLKEFRWEFFDAEKKRWFTAWDPEKRPVPPLFMRLHFQFVKDPRPYEFTYWIANDLKPVVAAAAQTPAAPKP